MVSVCKVASATALVACFSQALAAAPPIVKPMTLRQSRYVVRLGEPSTISASQETLDFLAQASKRTVSLTGGAQATGLVVAPNRAGRMVVAASSRATPGEYTVTVSATSSTGEERQAPMTVVVQPRVTVPSNSTRVPVVLLNGWETGFTNTCPVANSSADTFGNLAQYLVSDGVPVVYLFDNCLEDPNQSIEQLGDDLGSFLKTIQYDNGTQVPQIDLVAFSMGGLIVRAYLSGLQPNQSLAPPSPTLVRDVVFIATPNFGSFIAGTYANEILTGSQSAELVPGSALLWNLANWNQRSDDLHGVNAIGIAGNAGVYQNTLSGLYLNNASDGLVSLTSASMGFVYGLATPTRVVPYCHIDPAAFTNYSFGQYLCNAPGIANVTSTSHPTGQIVRSFLAGTTSWQSVGTPPTSDPYLSANGGMYFALTNAQGGYATDVSSVLWGTLQMQSGGNIGTIFYQDFVQGTGLLEPSSSTLGTINCGSYSVAFGYFSGLRCKLNAVIFNVGPLLSGTGIGRVVNASSGAITIAGTNLGGQCNGCKVTATPAAGGTQTLSVSSWSNTSITATLPSSLTGLVTIGVNAVSGSDAIAILVGAPSSAGATIASAPSSLQFNYTLGGTAPDSQTVQITNSGSGTLAWTATASDAWLSVSPASGTAPSTLTISVSPSGLSAGTYNGTVQVASTGASNTPQTIAVTLTVASGGPSPAISGVSNAASFQTTTASASWVSIFGTNLAPATYTWQDSDFVNGALPASLQGVSVTINGIAAYVEYVSPTQINVLAPDDSATGMVPVVITVSGQASNSFSVQKAALAPAFFVSGGYVAAEHSDYSLVTTASPAKAGETISLYGTGFGPANPAVPTGILNSTATPLANPVQIMIGGVNAQVSFAGLVGPGLYQFNVVVPSGVSGDAAVAATVAGVASQTGVLVSVSQL